MIFFYRWGSRRLGRKKTVRLLSRCGMEPYLQPLHPELQTRFPSSPPDTCSALLSGWEFCSCRWSHRMEPLVSLQWTLNNYSIYRICKPRDDWQYCPRIWGRSSTGTAHWGYLGSQPIAGTQDQPEMFLREEQQPDLPEDCCPLDCKLPEAGAWVSADFVCFTHSRCSIIYWTKIIAMICQAFSLDQIKRVPYTVSFNSHNWNKVNKNSDLRLPDQE